MTFTLRLIDPEISLIEQVTLGENMKNIYSIDKSNLVHHIKYNYEHLRQPKDGVPQKSRVWQVYMTGCSYIEPEKGKKLYVYIEDNLHQRIA